MVDRLIDEEFDSRLLFNQRTTALLIGISVQAFSAWGMEPAERRGREAFYRWPAVLAERDRRRAPPPPPAPNDPDENLDLEQERARLAKEQADKTALENAVRRGELLEAAEVQSAWSDIATSIRAHALSLGTKLAPELAPLTDANRIRDRIDREVHAFLSQAEAYRPRRPVEDAEEDRQEFAGPAPAAADPDGERVSGRESKAKPRKQRRARAVAH